MAKILDLPKASLDNGVRLSSKGQLKGAGFKTRWPITLKCAPQLQPQRAQSGLDGQHTCIATDEGRLYGQQFATRRAAMDEVIDWLAFYNHRRLHSTLGYVSPMQFEKSWDAAQRVKAA